MFIKTFMLAATILTGTAANAATLTIGSGTSLNTAPFAGGFPGLPQTNYQQVYAASSFGASPVAISSLSFLYALGSTPAGGSFTLSLSTTSKQVNGLNQTNFADNIGANDTTIFSGTLASQSDSDSLDFSFSPFLYNPLAGNLLLNVTASGVTSSGAAFKANNGDSNGVYSRASNFTVFSDNYGLQTVFTVNAAAATVPEPMTWALMIGGFGLVGTAMRRRTITALA